MIAAPVSQLLQGSCQTLGIAAFVSGGHQGIESAAQILVRRHRQIAEADEAGSAVDILLHPQQGLPTVGGGQLRDGNAGTRFIRPEFPQRDPALGGPLDGDVPALPMDIHPACHGASRPGSIVLLVGKGCLGALGPGIQAVEHGRQEGAPGTFAPLVGGMEDIQPRLQLQGLMLQLAEGGCHPVNSHGRATSLPASSFREISAARMALGSSSLNSRSSRK